MAKTPSSTWRVYILRCGDGSLYTGATSDSARRLEEHAAGAGARYTRSRLPVTLVYEEAASNRGAALRREAALKRLPRAEKLALIGPAPKARAPARNAHVLAPKARVPEPKVQLDDRKSARPKWTVRPVYRAIVKKNERQGKELYDVLICGHAVLAATDNTFRKARECPECRVRVQEYANQHAAQTQLQSQTQPQPAAQHPPRAAARARTGGRDAPEQHPTPVKRSPAAPTRRRKAARA